MTTAPLSQLDTAIQQHRSALLRRDDAVMALTIQRWRVAQRTIQTDLDALLARIAAADSPNAAWIRRQRDILTQIETVVDGYARSLEPTIVAGQQAAVTMAADHAQSLVHAQLGDRATWNTLPREATTELMGRLSDGSPLKDYLRQFGPAAAAAAEDALIGGIAAGKGVKDLQRQLAAIFGTQGAADPGAIGRRAMLTARQSVLGSYRSASLASYRANSDVLEGWTWLSALQPRRTCAVCWSMHGTVHPVTEEFASHIACRCTPAPRTKSWDALGLSGIPETRPTIEDGATVFARLTEAEQLEILGPTRLRLWQSGTPLSQMVERTHDRTWGDGRRVRALKEINA